MDTRSNMSWSKEWNSEKFKNGQYISDLETINLFNSVLQSDCKENHKHFIMLLADPLTTLRDMYWTFELDFLVFAFSFYQCDELTTQLCDRLVNKGQRAYFGILHHMEDSDYQCFQFFACKLRKTMEEKRRKEDELIKDFIRLNFSDNKQEQEPISFSLIYKHTQRP